MGESEWIQDNLLFDEVHEEKPLNILDEFVTGSSLNMRTYDCLASPKFDGYRLPTKLYNPSSKCFQ